MRVSTLAVVAEAAERDDAARCAVLTGGAVTSPGTQTARLLAWLAAQGIVLEDVTRATVEEALLTCAAPDAREVLEIRLRMARASTRKLVRMIQMADTAGDLALRGQFQFCGAGRTGRWSGQGRASAEPAPGAQGFSPGSVHGNGGGLAQPEGPVGARHRRAGSDAGLRVVVAAVVPEGDRRQQGPLVV